MSKRILCKFFAHGACLKGESCEYAHDWKTPANNICTFYQKGACAYADRCRYDHIKVSKLRSTASPSTAYTSAEELHSGIVLPSTTFADLGPGWSSSSETVLFPSIPAWGENDGHPETTHSDCVPDVAGMDSTDIPICSFASAGECPYGINCPRVHGDLCPSCKKHCLHPFRPQEREEHMKTCSKRQKYLETLARSQEIECSVCLERVLSKTSAAERKFGILSECNHPFCISCIRNWRSRSPEYGFDITSTLRSCPTCRQLSYFVIPSVIWYFSDEEKEEIINSYKAKLKSIDCKHFDFGSGTCPFGTSCFYKHAYRDGRLEEVVLRHLGSEDGTTVIAKNIRLSDFLSNMQI